MRKRWIVVWVMLTITLVIFLAFTLAVSAEEKCDASLEINVTPECLNQETKTGEGTIIIENTGEQGNTQLTLESNLTRGTGSIEPVSLTLTLGPGETKEYTFTLTIVEDEKDLPDGAQVEWMVTEEICRPDHNIGKRDRIDFPWCSATAITFVDNSFSANYVADSMPIWWWFFVILPAIALIGAASFLVFVARTISRNRT